MQDDLVYSPASITQIAEKMGYFSKGTKEDIKKRKQRMRLSLGRFSNNHAFPNGGDGHVQIKGQSPTPGWFGWRWKAALKR
ncbi:MAG: hypothetical protein QNK37_06985 [Acidobacteriota bacterium]|nr:hypothetical protein [Acidobacteriota bacterium]